MKDWPILEEVYPFICDNPKCKKEYNQSEFSSVMGKWGSILLTNDEFDFIGLTCTSCKKTSLHKYLKKYSVLPDENILPIYKTFHVSFFADDLPELGLDDDKGMYRVPRHISKLDVAYPDWFKNECVDSIGEADIRKILNYENKFGKKVFPRIVSSHSIYHQTDYFMPYMENGKVAEKDIDYSVRAVWLNGKIMDLTTNYLNGAPTNITEDEYKDLTPCFEMPNDYSQEFVDAIPQFLDDYLKIRNNIDFETSYKIEFLDKYIKQFYYVKGYYNSPARVYDKREYEDMLEKQSQFYLDSDGSQTMSHLEVMNRWKIDISILKRLIVSQDLPAYNIGGEYVDPRGLERHGKDIDIENLVFNKAEIKELELIKPRLFRGEGDLKGGDETPLSGEDKRRLGQLKREKEKWDASINAAVQIGIYCKEQDRVFKRKEISDKVFEIDKELPNTTFEKIWKAIPAQYRHQGGKPKKQKV